MNAAQSCGHTHAFFSYSPSDFAFVAVYRINVLARQGLDRRLDRSGSQANECRQA
jgi:hypothetical protein